jgi:hypothetical protein
MSSKILDSPWRGTALHYPRNFFELFLHARQGEPNSLDARGGNASLVVRDPVTVLNQKRGKQFRGLERVHEALPQFIAEALEFVLRKFLENTHAG